MFTHARLGHYVPVTWLTHGLDFVLFGMEPRGYHLTSIAFHAADAVLLYLLCCRLGTGAPLVAALFFAVHPLRVESVAWVTARRDVVCGFFVLLCVHAYVSASHRSGRARVSWLAGAIALFVLALLSKGLAMALPIGLLALDLTALDRLPWGWRRDRLGVLAEKVPFVLLSAASAAVSLRAAGDILAPVGRTGLSARVAAAAYSLVFYLGKTIWPAPIAVLVPWDPAAAVGRMPYLACLIASVAGAVIVVVASIFGPRRVLARAILSAFLTYAAFILPVSGLWQAGPQLVANRYSYLACLPWAILAGSLLRRTGRTGVLCAAIVLAALAVRARAEVFVWRSGETLWVAAVRSAPGAWMPRYGLAYVYIGEGRWNDAAREVDAGLAKNPTVPDLMHLSALLKAASPDPLLRDGAMALSQARAVVAATGGADLWARATLAEAQAETGDFAGAAGTARDALADAGRRDAPEIALHLRAILALFEEGKPYRMGDPSASRAGP